MTQFQEKGRYENVSTPFLMNTENLKPDPSTALTSYPSATLPRGCRPFYAEIEHTGSISGRSEPQDDIFIGNHSKNDIDMVEKTASEIRSGFVD